MTTYLRKNMFLIQKKDCLICYKRFFTRNTFKKNLKLEIGEKNKELLRNYSQDEILKKYQEKVIDDLRNSRTFFPFYLKI